jgi:hypothetical protein
MSNPKWDINTYFFEIEVLSYLILPDARPLGIIIIILIFYIASISQRFNNALQLRYIKMAISHVKILKC